MRAVNLLYVHSESIGYGRLGVHLASELENLGVTVIDSIDSPNVGEVHPKVAAWVSVPTHARGWWKGQMPVMFTMWEAHVLPEQFRESLHEFELVMVPSLHNVELFSRYHGNVVFNPLGVDPNVWHYTARRPPGQFFDFLIAGSGARKGTDLAYKAFRRIWGRDRSWPKDGPVPRLIFKNPRGEDFYGDRIEVISGRIPLEAEVALYQTAHCYLQPSRGEGFGLQPLQAIAQGCPTILTDAHGHSAFAHLGWGIPATPKKADYFIYGDAGEWWEPDFDALCEQMEWMYVNWEKAEVQARSSAAQVLAERFTWRECAKRFIDAVGEDNIADKVTGTEWYEPVLKRYPVITNRDWACSIAGTYLQFKKGQTYWETADVKRILFEAEILDPACFATNNEGSDWDSGLHPDQLERIPDYSATHSYCQLCGQKLGSGVTKTDELLAEAGL